nr:hypothetical protein [Thermoanaerobaculia bacterium]
HRSGLDVGLRRASELSDSKLLTSKDHFEPEAVPATLTIAFTKSAADGGASVSPGESLHHFGR